MANFSLASIALSACRQNLFFFYLRSLLFLLLSPSTLFLFLSILPLESRSQNDHKTITKTEYTLQTQNQEILSKISNSTYTVFITPLFTGVGGKETWQQIYFYASF